MSEEVMIKSLSRGAGCGCKIAPEVLDRIIRAGGINEKYNRLLVGYDTKDDAAVFDTGNGKAIISTTDFFMPIVDDAFDFGRIAAANALSDVYAMGGSPLLAIAILGWPVEKLPAEVAGKVLDGARAICREAGIPLAGGHSIDSLEPIFGLALTGEIEIPNIKRNSGAEPGNRIFLTKPLGTGIVTTAHKRGLARDEDLRAALDSMTALNSIGTGFGKLDYVKAMTDVTGFGLLGHLLEMCGGSGLSAEIEYGKVRLLENLRHYTSRMIYPDITFKNWKSFEAKVSGIGAESLLTLCDPQTGGGLLVAVEAASEATFIAHCAGLGYELQSIGQFTRQKEKSVYIT